MSFCAWQLFSVFLCAHQLRDFSPNCKNTNSIIPNSDSNDSFEFEFESVFRRFDCICAQIDVKRKERNLKNRFIVFASRIVLFSLSQCFANPPKCLILQSKRSTYLNFSRQKLLTDM